MSQTTFPLDPIEKASIDELRTLQLKRLQATLQHAYANSPAYRAKFDAAGVHPDDCKSLQDLAKFPSFSYSLPLVTSCKWPVISPSMITLSPLGLNPKSVTFLLRGFLI